MHRKYGMILAVFVAIVIAAAIITTPLPGSIYPQSPAVPEGSPVPSLPEAALPLAELLNSTYLLLHEPIGGFSSPLIWITGPDNATFNYTFYSRDYGPGSVTLTVSEVSAPLNTTPVAPSPGISARIIPDHFTALPGEETRAQLVVNISPEGYSHDAVIRTFWVHAIAEGEENAIADDWIRVRMGDRPTTYIIYATTGEIDGQDITVNRGGRWAGNLTVSTGERGTGPLLVWVKELDCGTMYFSSLDTPAPSAPGSPAFSIDPARFTARSFGNYKIPVVITTNPDVLPGTYCYKIAISAPDTNTSFSSRVQVTP